MILSIRKSKLTKALALLMVPLVVGPIAPQAVAADGPADVNHQGGVSSNEMVDLSTGDFNYTLPLLNVGGHPINLSYNPDVSRDQQASIVGFGWSLNATAINRTVRGLPDDFNGDELRTEMNIRSRLVKTYEGKANIEGIGLDVELSPIENEEGDTTGLATTTTQLNLTPSFTYIFDNYTGNESVIGLGGGASGKVVKEDYKTGSISTTSIGLNGGVNSSSKSGLSSNVALSVSNGKKIALKSSLGLTHNSIHGNSLETSFGLGVDVKIPVKNNTDYHHFGATGSGSWPLGMGSYTPSANFDFSNKSVSWDVAAGGLPFAGTDLHGGFTFTKSTTCLNEKVRKSPAYGYLNSENAYANPEAVQDFNLAIPAVHEATQGVNTPMPTNDYFSVASGSTFRALRNDAGYVRDPRTRTVGKGKAISGDAAFGNGTSVGINVRWNNNSSTTGEWRKNNAFSEDKTYRYSTQLPGTVGTSEQRAFYQAYTFVTVGESATLRPDQYEALQKNSALRQEIEKVAATQLNGGTKLTSNANKVNTVLNSYYQQERRGSQTVYQPQTNRELDLTKYDLPSCDLNDFEYDGTEYVSEANLDRANYPADHIGGFTVSYPGGGEEFYSIPVMNRSSQVSFNMSAITAAGTVSRQIDTSGLITYLPGADNSPNNNRGDDNFFLKNSVPDHATAYLLTESRSANYADRTGDGPTPDDYGDYVKFNYTFLGETTWRYPYQQNQATYNEGFRADPLDDRGNYTFGYRDVWMPHSIETKEWIAEFKYGARNDGFDVAGENGGRGSVNRAYKLEAIYLYTRKEKELRSSSAKPTKTVLFEYDYSLCPGTPDNNLAGGGKLTLKKVRIVNYESGYGQLFPYAFHYEGENPGYIEGNVDRWGNYRKGTQVNYNPTGEPGMNEYPYAVQDKNVADQEASAWKLTSIDMPTGSRMTVAYEADDYTHVQDHPATRMFRIDGFLASNTEAMPTMGVGGYNTSQLFTPGGNQTHFYIRVNLADFDGDGIVAASASEALEIFNARYLPVTKAQPGSNDRLLYFNVLCDLAPKAIVPDPSAHEYVQGYARIRTDRIQLFEKTTGSGVYDRAVIKLLPEDLNEGGALTKQVNPISRKAWQITKDALPLVLYPETNLQEIYANDGDISCAGEEETGDGGTKPTNKSPGAHTKNLLSIRSIYRMMQKTGYASKAEKSKSWVRLRTGTDPKIGGGYRVKSIKIYDNWDKFVAGESASVYGTRYRYTTTNNLGETVSSGVASYEPLGSGADEIALRHPKFYVHQQSGVPNERYYTEYPLNESIFATSQIKYGKVTLSSIAYAGLEKNTTGRTEYHYYTAKNYPIRFDYTKDTEVKKPGPLNAIIGRRIRRFGISFGASIVTNNMHGKLKGKYVYSAPTSANPNGNLIYKMENHYREDAKGHLKSSVKAVDAAGNISTRLVGLTLETLTHLNESKNTSTTNNVQGQFEFSAPLVFVPSLWYTPGSSETTVLSTLTTKVVTQSGLIERVTIEEDGKLQYVSNLLYDAVTGAPLVTQVNGERGPGAETVYQYNYPAHWAYEGMGLRSTNAGLSRANITNSTGRIKNFENPFYFPGDELEVTATNSAGTIEYVGRYWVVKNETNDRYFLADHRGNVLAPDGSKQYSFHTIVPGRKGLTGVTMAGVTNLSGYNTDLHPNAPYGPGYEHSNVVNVSGADFDDVGWLLPNSCYRPGITTINPHIENIRGQWKAKHTYVYDGQRDYSTGNSRYDGKLVNYQPFWKNASGTWVPIYDPGYPGHTPGDPLQDWILTGAVEKVDSYGHTKEATDVLKNRSASYYGYNNRMPVASAVNSPYAASAVDNFEDYFFGNDLGDKDNAPYDDCAVRHFGIDGLLTAVTEEAAHTGNYSLRVWGAQSETYTYEVWDGVEVTPPTAGQPFLMDQAHRLTPFRLVKNGNTTKYLITVWVRETNLGNHQSSFDDLTLSVKVGGTTVPMDPPKRSGIIDGWQRLEYVLEITGATPNGTPFELSLNNAGPDKAYFDDLRIQPYESELESSVMDPVKVRPMATLGPRNFATMVQYDEEGRPVRTVIETARGKQTVEETRNGIKSVGL